MLTSIKKVQAFLKLANYYRKFILRFKHIALPLTDLTKKNNSFNKRKKRNKFLSN